jgi:hypothetical protein
MDGERVDAAGKFTRERGIDHAVAIEPALSAEGFRHDMQPEMSFSARPVSGMAFVAVGFVLQCQAVGREGLAQLFRDEIASRHTFSRLTFQSFKHDSGKGLPPDLIED